jgi:hypothetical protein
MSAYQSEVDDLIDQAETLPYGDLRVALCEKAVQLADAANDLDAGDYARNALIDAATFNEEPEKAIVAFTWRLAQSDRNPERFSIYDLLWQFKWAVAALDEFYEMSWERILDMLADMERRYEAAGASLRAPFKLRASLYRQAGMKKEENQAFKVYRKRNSGWPSDCEACEQDELVVHHLFRNEFDQAWQAGTQIFKGKLTCSTVPARTLGRFLLPLLERDRAKEAEDFHQRCYRKIVREGDTYRLIHRHLRYLGMIGEVTPALRNVERFFARQTVSGSPSDRWQFISALRFLLLCMPVEQREKQTLRLSGPESLPASKNSRHTLGQTLKWCETTLEEMAAKFDARNKTAWFTKQMKADVKLAKSAVMHQ